MSATKVQQQAALRRTLGPNSPSDLGSGRPASPLLPSSVRNSPYHVQSKYAEAKAASSVRKKGDSENLMAPTPLGATPNIKSSTQRLGDHKGDSSLTHPVVTDVFLSSGVAESSLTPLESSPQAWLHLPGQVPLDIGIPGSDAARFYMNSSVSASNASISNLLSFHSPSPPPSPTPSPPPPPKRDEAIVGSLPVFNASLQSTGIDLLPESRLSASSSQIAADSSQSTTISSEGDLVPKVACRADAVKKQEQVSGDEMQLSALRDILPPVNAAPLLQNVPRVDRVHGVLQPTVVPLKPAEDARHHSSVAHKHHAYDHKAESASTYFLNQRAKVATSFCIGEGREDRICTACRDTFDDSDGYYVPHLGEIIMDRFYVEVRLGQGTFGTVVQVVDLNPSESLAEFDNPWRRVGWRQPQSQSAMAKIPEISSMSPRYALKIVRAIPKYRAACKDEIRVLKSIQHDGPSPTSQSKTGKSRCIPLLAWFEHRHHLCLLFPLLKVNLFSFMEQTRSEPFPLTHVQTLGKQLGEAIAHLHSQGLIHTDLKPENIMLLNDIVTQAAPLPPNRTAHQQIWRHFTARNTYSDRKSRHVLASPALQVIDFGSAVMHTAYHSDIASTRHYRAPEIILLLGWSFPADVWSFGCILMELFLGRQLFSTHDYPSHLKLMERLFGTFPSSMIHPRYIVTNNRFVHVLPYQRYHAMVGSCTVPLPASYFDDQTGRVLFPSSRDPTGRYHVSAVQPVIKAYVDAMPPIEELILPAACVSTLSHATRYALDLFLDLIRSLLQLDPKKRPTIHEALMHPFFRHFIQPDD